MINLVDEIRECFASICANDKARKIQCLPDDYQAYAVRLQEGYGVAIETFDDSDVSEKFNSCKFYTRELRIEGEFRNYLILSSVFEEYRYEFASICAEFVDPGQNGLKRKELLNNPHEWWYKWKELIGNTSCEQRVYDVIGEMLVLAAKLDSAHQAQWASMKAGSHDIECLDESCEVKSTIKRYGATVTISGQHQLLHEKPLWLYFIRMEESLEGVSINDVKVTLLEKGYDEGKLESELEKIGFEHGAIIRTKKYKVLEKRKYLVDENFPKITADSFKDNKFPSSIIHIEYTVDLDGIEYTTW